MENANTIHHTMPEEVHTAAEAIKPSTPLRNDWKSQEFVGRFAKYIDDKDSTMEDTKITTADLKRADV